MIEAIIGGSRFVILVVAALGFILWLTPVPQFERSSGESEAAPAQSPPINCS